jgi:hypothetical protein
VLGVTRLPPWFEQAFSTFEPVFSDSRNVDSFKHLVSALILAEPQWTVSGLSRRAYDYFFGGTDWSATDLAQCHIEYVFEQITREVLLGGTRGTDTDILLASDHFCLFNGAFDAIRKLAGHAPPPFRGHRDHRSGGRGRTRPPDRARVFP